MAALRIGVVLLLVLTATTAGLASGDAIADLSLTGDGVLETGDTRSLVTTWQETTVELRIAEPSTREVCLRANSSGASVALPCRSTGAGPVTISLSAWPGNLSGRTTLVATARGANGTVLARTSQPVWLLTPEGDYDDDGLTNRAERAGETNPLVADTDRDGLADGSEQRTYRTNPNATDTDGDGVADGVEVRRYETDPTTADTDDDGLPDGVELTTYGTDPTDPDSDGDGLADGREVNQERTDPTAPDTDGDGLADGQEVTVHGTNPRRVDSDGDGLRDGPEVNEYGTDPTDADTDGDGFEDGAEVRRYETDPTRANPVTDGQPQPRGADEGGVGISSLSKVVVGVSLVGVFLGCCAVVWRHRHERSTPGRQRTGSDHRESLAHPDAEQIHRLLAEHDGCLPQSEIVDRTDWSKSKVSRVLSAMADAEEVRKIPLGRENLVARPGDEPAGAHRPFEND